jgi:DeoR family fructose operon transcriptional repressor
MAEKENRALPIERQEHITSRLRDEASVAFRELADELSVSTMTIRRDAATLERQGVLTLTAGGVARRPRLAVASPTPPHDGVEVASATLRALRQGALIYLDSGAQAVSVMQITAGRTDLSVVTPSLDAAEVLQHHTCEVIITGGRLDRTTKNFGGPVATAVVAQLAIDFAILTDPSATDGDEGHELTGMVNDVAAEVVIVGPPNHGRS